MVAIERCKPTVSVWQDVIFITKNNILICRQFCFSSRSVIRIKGILLFNLSLLCNTGTAYLGDEITIVDRLSFSFE